jgi:DNA polymerase III subunit epsilon
MPLLSWLKFRRKQPTTGIFPLDTPLHSVRYVVLDTEFTSLDRRSNRLLSIGAVTMQGPSIGMGDQFYRVLNPGVELPPSAILVHKLRPTDIQQGEPTAQVLADLRNYIAGAVLVGHFVKLDVDLLRKELRATGHSLDNLVVCTAKVYRWLLQKGRYSEDLAQRLENVDLSSLAKIYNIEFREAHHALDDAFVTARLWQKLIYELKSQGVTTLADLLRIGTP